MITELDPRQSTRDLMQNLNVLYVQLSMNISSELGKLARREFEFLMSFHLRTEYNVPPSLAAF